MTTPTLKTLISEYAIHCVEDVMSRDDMISFATYPGGWKDGLGLYQLDTHGDHYVGDHWDAVSDAILDALRDYGVLVDCSYCGEEVVEDGMSTPHADDGDAWADLATVHLDGCEWITTRAHRIES
jgi:hypothetical protein